MELSLRHWRAYLELMRWHRPEGSLLLLWPTLWALWIAGDGRPPAWLVLVFVAGVFVTRSAGCVINDYFDRQFDAKVARTRARPLPRGAVGPREAATLAAGLFGVALLLTIPLSPLTRALAVVGAAIGATYPLMKRVMSLPQAYLGIAFGWGIPMAFAQIQGRIPPVAWWLLAANVCWALAYDTAYAMADRADDEQAGVRSSARLFGRGDRVMIALADAVALSCLWVVGQRAGLGRIYDGALVVAALLAAYEQRWLATRAPDDCLRAFRHNNWVGGVVFAGLWCDYFWRALS